MGKLGPKDGIPYHTANRSPFSNQRLPEILEGRHPLGGSTSAGRVDIRWEGRHPLGGSTSAGRVDIRWEGRHPLGESWLNTGRMHPTGAGGN